MQGSNYLILTEFIILLILHCTLSKNSEYYSSRSVDNKDSNDSFVEQVTDDQSIILLSSNDFEALNIAHKLTTDTVHHWNKRDVNWRSFYDEDKVKKLHEFKREKTTRKRASDPVFHGHPKTTEEMWNEHFLKKSKVYDQAPSLIKLIHNITLTYLNDCTPVILYGDEVKEQDNYLYQNLLKDFPVTYIHGYIKSNNKLTEPKLLLKVRECLHFIIFLYDIETSAKLLGKQPDSKVLVIARSSQWAVQEFLAGPMSRNFVNLLVIGQSFKTDEDEELEAPYILYTHKLYTDGLGASQPMVLNSWSHGKYSRDVNLFPLKMSQGYAGHRFIVAAANQPPFVIRRIQSDKDGGNPRVVWDGIEIRLLKILAEMNNFSIEIIEPRESLLGPGDAVSKELAMGRADVGVAGIYVTNERVRDMDMTFPHSQDCAAFITLMSTALPRYRAILGPFHWHVWITLIFTYLIGIFPLAFSDKHTLRHLIHNSGEVENMFWYVFGTFTNCFTFVGKNSWSKSTKITTRLLIGMYWIFTIIITSCYTGSIIAFVTLPVFPETIDTIQQLLGGFFRIGTLDRGGWERWFINSSDPYTNKLLRKVELLPNVQSGIRNTTKGFFWSYAFLGSRSELEYIVQANFTNTKSKRAVLHISNECFVPFGVSLAFPNNSLYSAKLSSDIRRMFQSGIMVKIIDEVRWEIQRSSSGKLLSADKGALKVSIMTEKGLTLEDTQGMFLLLAAGFLVGAAALISEWMGGCSRKCNFRKKVVPSTVDSRTDLHNTNTTPKSDVDAEIEIIPDRSESRLNFGVRSSSVESEDMEGQIINVTEDNITVHENFDIDKWDSRRSSSVDLDKEVREIFEKDQKRRRVVSDAVTGTSEDNRQPTASKGAFGDHLINS